MKKLKVLLYVFIAIVVLLGGMLIFVSKGLKEAKSLEISNIDLTQLTDGEYTGSYENGRFSSDVEVTIKDHEIVEINRISERSDPQASVYEEIIDAVISEQKVDIDTVSGATATTNALLKAIEDALN